MKKTRQIKIIKKNDLGIAQISRVKKITTKKTNKDHQMTSTISKWIKDFQQHRCEESI